uniref:(northern house mosquito) hypothetical protein n=1 Tax=Culex pipiens TaxID=7175 RepID=A0A8D7ZWC6_CULPI
MLLSVLLRSTIHQTTTSPQHFRDDCFCVAVCLILTPISLPPTIAAAAAAYFTPPREASIDFPNNNNNSSSQTDSPSAPSSWRCILVFHHVFRLPVFPPSHSTVCCFCCRDFSPIRGVDWIMSSYSCEISTLHDAI